MIIDLTLFALYLLLYLLFCCNLDTENTKTISTLFLSLVERHGKTVIMASDDPKAVEQFKKVYNMRDGNLV